MVQQEEEIKMGQADSHGNCTMTLHSVPECKTRETPVFPQLLGADEQMFVTSRLTCVIVMLSRSLTLEASSETMSRLDLAEAAAVKVGELLVV